MGAGPSSAQIVDPAHMPGGLNGQLLTADRIRTFPDDSPERLKDLDGFRINIQPELINGHRIYSVKGMVRQGIPHKYRPQVWKILSGASFLLSDRPSHYQNTFDAALRTTIDISSFRPSVVHYFGATDVDLESCGLNGAGVMAAQRILYLLADLHSHSLSYCPIIAEIVVVLLHYLPEPEAFTTAHVMVERTLSEGWYYGKDPVQVLLFTETFWSLAERHCSDVFKHLKAIGMDARTVFSDMFSCVFRTTVSPAIQMRIFDSYVCEGYKVLDRIGLTVLHFLRSRILACTTAEQAVALFHTRHDFDETAFMKHAFKLPLLRKKIHDLEERNKAEIGPSIREIASKSGYTAAPFYRPLLRDESAIIRHLDWETIWTFLPERMKLRTARLVYSTKLHGFALSTLFQQCGLTNGPCLVIIQGRVPAESLAVKNTNPAQVFGGYFTDPLRPCKEYYGTKECFLWSLTPNQGKYMPNQTDPANTCFIGPATAAQLAFGAGGTDDAPGFGLILSDLLAEGFSFASDTYGNPPLCGSNGRFEILQVEVYNFSVSSS